MTATVEDLMAQGRAARQAARQLARLSAGVKNQTLNNLAGLLENDVEELLRANAEDCAGAKADGLSDAMIDRLLLTPERLRGTAAEQRKIASLPDPVGETIEMNALPNGMTAGRRRVPLGVVASIYESRPNVTVDIFGLCFKSGNACILRGGKEALRSNSVLVRLIRRALTDAGAPAEAVQFVDNPDRELVDAMLKMNRYIDLIVPRGGDGLVRFVGENATMPAVTGGVGVCHTYVDRAADLDMAANVAINAKVRRPYICNALDTLLVLHADHEQNCSTSTVRMAGSSGVNPFSALAAGCIALWGPAHGGANEAVLKMLEAIGSPERIDEFVGRAKDPDDPFRLMGFGHRVYKNFDPRATIIRGICHEVLKALRAGRGRLFRLARNLEEIALRDSYFKDRRLYPNVDFYSGIIYRALGLPAEMFTPMFAIGRAVGWAAHWCEMHEDPELRIGRPRQLYLGPKLRGYVPAGDR